MGGCPTLPPPMDTGDEVALPIGPAFPGPPQQTPAAPPPRGSETPSNAHPPLGTCQTAPNSKKAQATSTATQFSASEFLKKHETEFFEVINPRLSLLRLVRKGVITEDVKLDINTSNTDDAREVLYHHLAHHANVDTLKEYLRVAIAADGYPNMQSLGRKMIEELEQGGEQTH